MKKNICLFLISITTITFVIASGAGKRSGKISEPSATLQKMWVEYGVTEGSRYGMMMHISFTAYDMKGVKAYLGAYMKYNDGKPDSYIMHKSKIGQPYYTKTGILSVGKDIIPTYVASVYEDIQLFMPYDEFDLIPGTYDLIIDVQLLYIEGGAIAWLKQYNIEFTEPDKDRGPSGPVLAAKNLLAPTTGPRAVFDSMWVDYDVMDNGVKGMMLHFKFTAYEMKDMEELVAVYFLFNDAQGGVLKDKNQKYASSAGDVAVYKDIKPMYDPAIYDDLPVFMPYAELDLDPGTYQLTMEAKLIYKVGGLISNFSNFNFRFTQAKN